MAKRAVLAPTALKAPLLESAAVRIVMVLSLLVAPTALRLKDATLTDESWMRSRVSIAAYAPEDIFEPRQPRECTHSIDSVDHDRCSALGQT